MLSFSKSLLSVALAIGIFSLTAHAETRTSGQAVWNTSAETTISLNSVPNNKSQLIFVRFNDNLPSTTSANLAVDNMYHISLQPNHLSQVLVCTGPHSLSAQSTANKSNDLSFNAQAIQTESAQTYFFDVRVDEQGNTSVTPLDSRTEVDNQNLLDYLAGLPKQAHQINRVVEDCPAYVAPEPVPKPTPSKVEVVLDKPINLAVLFEFDKAVIQPVYNQPIEAVAEFMIKYPNTRTVIEGHTDSVGSDRYNLDLSQRRADAVKQELVSKYGIAPNRMATIGYGETKPVDTNATAAGRHNNRRVVATVSATQE